MKDHESFWLVEAGRRHGVVHHRQLVEAGLSARQVRLRVAGGLLEVVHRGVYRVVGSSATFEQAALAACLASRGIASHRCAAALWSLRGFEPGPVEVTVVGRRRPELAGVVGHTTAHLRPVDATERLSVPVTTPARTLLDLAAVVGPDRVESALHDAVLRRLVSLSWLERTVARSPTRPGAGALADLLGWRRPGQPPTESVLEDLLVQVLRDGGLPDPVLQHVIEVPGFGSVRLDAAYVPELVAIETQGARFHSSRVELQRDCDKRNLLVRLGWRVLVFTWHDVRHCPGQVVDVVRSALDLPRPASR